jgi:ribonuclease HI
LDVRLFALYSLFDALEKNGNVFSRNLWISIFKRILITLLDEIRHVEMVYESQPLKVLGLTMKPHWFETPENTNNKNELLSVELSLDYLISNPIDKHIIYVVDSLYVVNIFSGWLEKWIEKKQLENKAHKMIILRIYEKLKNIEKGFKFQHINSHTNNLDYLSKGNDKIDREVQKYTSS